MDLNEYIKSKGVAKQSGFYYSLLGLSKAQKKSLTTLYAFCREVDDIVDEGLEPSIALLKIQFWFQEIERVFLNLPHHPIGFALMDVCKKYPLQKQYFKEILNGMLMDLDNKSYATFADLSVYCYSVASCVGLLVVEILGVSPSSDPSNNSSNDSSNNITAFAKNLGIALQLINIIRDVGEDVRRGRIYLPQEELALFNVSESEIIKGEYSDRFLALMGYQANRAKEYYHKALSLLSSKNIAELQPAIIMGEIYFDLLRTLEISQFQVLHQKIKLTKFRKLTIAFLTLLKIIKIKYIPTAFQMAKMPQ